MAKKKVTTIEGLADSIGGLKTHMDKRFDDVIQSVAKGFESEHEYMENRFNDIEKKLDVRKRVEEHEKKINRLGELFDVKF